VKKIKYSKLLMPTSEAERKKLYRWHKKGIVKKVKIIQKSESGRPRNYYVFNPIHFRKIIKNFESFLNTVKEIKEYVPFAIGLPFSLLRYKYLQVSSIYIYSDSENLHDIKDIFSDYQFLIIKEIHKSVLNRRLKYKNFPLLSIEDTIISAIKDAQNIMVAFTLLYTQSEKIDYQLLNREVSIHNIDLSIFKPLMIKENKHSPFHSLDNSNNSELKTISKASKSILRNIYTWDEGISFISDTYNFIDGLR